MGAVVVVTNCTRRKRLKPVELAHFRQLPPMDLSSAAQTWLAGLDAAPVKVAPHELYAGRSFAEARRAAELLDAPLMIVSAGLGLIPPDARVPAYEATVSGKGEDSVPSRFGCTAAEWWSTLALEGRVWWPQSARLVLVALSSPYLVMIADDLRRMPAERLRLFTRGSSANLPEHLHPALMPYDARLDSTESPIRGTVNDFAQRAVAHFAEHVLPASPHGDAHAHFAAVNKALAMFNPPEKRTGRAATDAEIRSQIAERWHEAEGRSTRMLHVLRRDLGIACEQSRFRKLFLQVAAART